jgi:hypothetical protein
MTLTTLRHAFKEWAVICAALAEGRQAIILRKGGIAEAGGDFQVEHTRFWLYPTYLHQQRTGITAETMPLLEKVEAARPPEGIVRLTHFAESPGAYRVHNLATAWMLGQFHGWSPETVQARFTYRTPGLFVIPVRVYQAAQVIDLPENPAYAGCRSWVELDQELPTAGATPVLTDQAFDTLVLQLERVLQPTAWA